MEEQPQPQPQPQLETQQPPREPPPAYNPFFHPTEDRPYNLEDVLIHIAALEEPLDHLEGLRNTCIERLQTYNAYCKPLRREAHRTHLPDPESGVPLARDGVRGHLFGWIYRSWNWIWDNEMRFFNRETLDEIKVRAQFWTLLTRRVLGSFWELYLMACVVPKTFFWGTDTMSRGCSHNWICAGAGCCNFPSPGPIWQLFRRFGFSWP